MKKEVALVFGITSNYTFALANTLIGLVKHNRKFWDDIIVFCDNIEETAKNQMMKIANCKFIYNSDLKYTKNVPQEVVDKYSPACFYRFECFNLLKDYKTVIWNDVDILIKGDISGLLKYGEKKGFALTQTSGGFKNEANFNKLLLDYDMFCPLYNSGILVMHDNLAKYEEMCTWCINCTIKYAEYLRWPDQGVLNLLLQEFKIDFDLIDIEKYCCHPSLNNEIIDNALIIHAYGDGKFWNDDNIAKRFPEWDENNKYWLSLSKDINKMANKEQPLVSCIMSTYNRYDYLDESVKSILEQSYKNIELIIVLEKCENQTKIEKILKNYKDDRIVIIKNEERLGFAKSLNIAMKKAKGKYITRMDDDDISLPTRFEKQVAFMEEHPEIGISGTNAQFFGLYDSVIGVETDPEVLKIMTLYKTPLVHPTVIMNKNLIEKYDLYYDQNYFTEDYELWSRAIGFFKIGNIPEVLLKYRTGCDNLTNGNNEDKIHSSHKKIMSNQLTKYLNLELSNNELEMLQGRLNIIDSCFNREEALEIRNSVYKKIIEKNNSVNFYNSEKLNKIFNNNNKKEQFNQSKMKKIIKKLFRPIYIRLMNRVENLIIEHDNRIYNYINERIKIIKEEKSE